MKHACWVIIGVVLLSNACVKRKEPQNVSLIYLELKHKWGDEAFALGKPLTTPSGEPVTVQVYRYYISGFSLIYENGSRLELPGWYYLVDEANAASKNLAIEVPEGRYRELRFHIGVDSARNVSGVQDGALDPANGMFWTWNSGYIFAKLEGRSPVSPAPLQAVTYHVGGFRTGQNAYQMAKIPFGATVSVENAKPYKALLEADVSKWFSGAHNISIATHSYTMDPGPLAMMLAENYTQIFTLADFRQQ
jgi:hypothetical protein